MEKLRKQFEKLVHDCEHPRCPECGETEISDCHHEADYSTDECDFFVCTNCGHQWGME